MSISVVLPVYNEESTIEKVLRDYNREMQKLPDFEMIVVDDCSVDSTPGILAGLSRELPSLKVLKTDVNSGHGASLMLGFANAGKQMIFYTDSDECFRADDFWKLYNNRDKAALISGCRVNRKDPAERIIISRIVKLFIKIMFGIKITDPNSSFKLIRKQHVLSIETTLRKHGIKTCTMAPSIVFSIVAAGKNELLEMPVEYFPRKNNRSCLRGLKLLKFCITGLWGLFLLKSVM